MLNVAATCAAAGIIVGVVAKTGLGLKFSAIVISLRGRQPVPDRALHRARSCGSIGLAVPVTASYIICAVIAAPALTKLGVPDFAAHMFIFYYAVLSEVSPPTALSPFAAAAITGGDPYKTTLQSWKYTLPHSSCHSCSCSTRRRRACCSKAPPEGLVARRRVDRVHRVSSGIAALATGTQGLAAASLRRDRTRDPDCRRACAHLIPRRRRTWSASLASPPWPRGRSCAPAGAGPKSGTKGALESGGARASMKCVTSKSRPLDNISRRRGAECTGMPSSALSCRSPWPRSARWLQYVQICPQRLGYAAGNFVADTVLRDESNSAPPLSERRQFARPIDVGRNRCGRARGVTGLLDDVLAGSARSSMSTENGARSRSADTPKLADWSIASSCRFFMSSTDWPSGGYSHRLAEILYVSPAAARIACAFNSVSDFGVPTDTRLPFRSCNRFTIPVARAQRPGYSSDTWRRMPRASALSGTFEACIHMQRFPRVRQQAAERERDFAAARLEEIEIFDRALWSPAQKS